jgi:holo-[acyl-carrier protein] synthase
VSVLGVGIDVVDVAAFRVQLDDPASGFVAATFTAGERRDAERPAGDRTERLAARFAAKEALVKAWAGARYGRPPAAASVDLRQIEVVLDGWGRPGLRLHGAVRDALADLAPEGAGDADPHLSLSHDGGVATAIVVLSSPA